VKITKQMPVPATTRTVTLKTVCDLCGVETNRAGNWPSETGDNWNETTIEAEIGWNYGHEGASYKRTTVDICPKCFMEKLIPWVESLGGKPTVEQIEG